MSTDVKQQVVSEIKTSPLFSVQLDESTDVSPFSQLLIFALYVRLDGVKEEFLFCGDLESTPTAQDVISGITQVFKSGRLAEEKAMWRMYGWSTSDALNQI